MKIKTGDLVAVIAGQDQFTTDKNGKQLRKTGRVLKVLHKTNRVIVEGVNVVKKHQRPNQQNQKGQIIEQPAPIDISNVLIIDPKSKQPTRVGYKMHNGKKVRVAKKSGEILDK